MKKLVKIINLILLGLIGITLINCGDSGAAGTQVKKPRVPNVYTKIEKKIDSICQSSKWSLPSYRDVTSDINAYDKNDIFNSVNAADELRKYLFISSCKLLQADLQVLFKTSDYEVQKFTQLQRMKDDLNREESNLDKDGIQVKGIPSLKSANEMFNQYAKAKSLLGTSFSKQAYYPLLHPFDRDYMTVVNNIKSLTYYPAYLSNNAKIAYAVKEGLKQRYEEARNKYYYDLENSIEHYYQQQKDLLDTDDDKDKEERSQLKRKLMTDQQTFNKLNAGKGPTARLSTYVSNF